MIGLRAFPKAQRPSDDILVKAAASNRTVETERRERNLKSAAHYKNLELRPVTAPNARNSFWEVFTRVDGWDGLGRARKEITGLHTEIHKVDAEKFIDRAARLHRDKKGASYYAT